MREGETAGGGDVGASQLMVSAGGISTTVAGAEIVALRLALRTAEEVGGRIWLLARVSKLVASGVEGMPRD